MDVGKEDLPLYVLPQNVVYDMIMDTDDFWLVINLYTFNRQAFYLLSGNITINSHLDLFVSDVVNERLPPNKLNLLQHLNLKFHLRVPSPLTFVKLVRAYKRSAFNPLCYEYNSILDCLQSAARSGLDRGSLYTVWVSSHRMLADRLAESNVTLPELTRLKSYSEIMNKLAVLAYKNNHLQLGDSLLLPDPASRSEKVVYFQLKAWSRYFLRPCKVRTNREIYQEHANTLFDPEVDHSVKEAIWASQYDLAKFPLAKSHLIAKDVWLAIKARTGELRWNMIPLGLPQAVYIALTQLACRSGNSQAMAAPMTFLSDASVGKELRVITLLKRGFFRILTRMPNPSLPMEVWGKSTLFIRWCRKWPLARAKLLINVVNLLSKDMRASNTYFLLETVRGNTPELYLEAIKPCEGLFAEYRELFIQVDIKAQTELDRLNAETPKTLYHPQVADIHLKAIDVTKQIRSLETGNLKLSLQTKLSKQDCPTARALVSNMRKLTFGSISMINDILNKSVEFEPHGDLTRGGSWVDLNYKLLVQIWKTYGRQRFEDCLMYLRVNFAVQTDSKLFTVAIENNARGLLAYMFGFNYKLEPLPRLGLIELNPQILHDVDILALVKAGAFPDTILFLLDLKAKIKG